MKKPVYLINLAFFVQVYIYSNALPGNVSLAQAQTAGQKFLETNDDANKCQAQIPTPPMVSLPEPTSLNAPSGSALSWRSRALALANEYPLKKNSIAWALPVSYLKGQVLLKQAIEQSGLVLLSEYDDAGQFLISFAELATGSVPKLTPESIPKSASESAPKPARKGDIIVISQPVSETKTLFKMHIYANGEIANMERANCLPDTMKNLLENHGLWQ